MAVIPSIIRDLLGLPGPEGEEHLVSASVRRRQERLRSHAIAGAAVFLGLQVLLGFPGILSPLRLIGAAFVSVIFGAPTGLVVSARHWGPLGGALISSGMFVVMIFLCQLPSLFTGTSVGVALLSSLVYGVLMGAVPGIFIGWHVRVDR